jgi:hypothetical protein
MRLIITSLATQRLAPVGDFAYHHRGRMVLVWIVSTIAIIDVGSALAGEYEADYDTPGSESEAASHPANLQSWVFTYLLATSRRAVPGRSGHGACPDARLRAGRGLCLAVCSHEACNGS